MQNVWDTSLQPALRRAGIDLRRYPAMPAPTWREAAFTEALAARRGNAGPDFTSAVDFLKFSVSHANESNAQRFQDLFVRWKLEDKLQGYFVEFGASDGVSLSNSYGLELYRAWHGVLAEPARIWQQALRKNRRAEIDSRCVWTRSGETLVFNEAPVAEFSTIHEFSQKDAHAEMRTDGTSYEVSSVSLNDLLLEHRAPPIIDYLSVDTEGSELSILSELDFSKYTFRVITLEHNYTDNRPKLFELLTSRGYRRVFPEFSGFDDWYVLGTL